MLACHHDSASTCEGMQALLAMHGVGSGRLDCAAERGPMEIEMTPER